MKCTAVISTRGDDFLNYCNANMLRGITPEIWDDKSQKTGIIRCFGTLDDELILRIGDPYTNEPYRGHIDIESDQSMLVYDLGVERKKSIPLR